VVWRAQDGEGEDRLGLAAVRWRRKGRWIILCSSGRAGREFGVGPVGALWCMFVWILNTLAGADNRLVLLRSAQRNA